MDQRMQRRSTWQNKEKNQACMNSVINLNVEEEVSLIAMLEHYRDIFTQTYKDLKGVGPKIYQYTIPMREEAKLCKQRPYTHNDTFAKKITKEITKVK